MPFVRRTSSAVVAVLAAVTLAACGAVSDDADADAVSGDAGDSEFSLGPKVDMTFELDGATTLKGKQTALAPSLNGKFLKSCDEYSQGTKQDDGKTLFAIAGLLDGNVDGRKVTVELWIDDYTGPGTYPKDQLVAPGSRPSIAIDNKVYGTWPESTSSEVTTDGDGGGTWTFRKLATTGEGGLPGDPVDGTLKWTCSNP
ncbi:hypothetical protein JIG36_41680 [Actinoplanes sp. LDG1-06]|uniref:Lipoprotein n=1 Tax=Paractinoplanes ovalisporus TaxID=2810368 RepID=A0ABS2AQ89_9ACTN|nr:hypothetical protein [Actinoplanes ovalisporus]MBM2622034.1 hypothetical protein [Actinoplanes ovalisporus]